MGIVYKWKLLYVWHCIVQIDKGQNFQQIYVKQIEKKKEGHAKKLFFFLLWGFSDI